MSNKEEVMIACDWCLQEARVQTIDDHLWRFWKIISAEDPIMTSNRNICEKCKSHYQGFSIYIEMCKINTSKVDELLSMRQVKDEPSVDIEYPTLIKQEISDELDWNSYHPSVSGGVFSEGQMLAGCSNSPMKITDSTIDILSAGNVEKEPLIDIDDYLIIEQEAFDPDYSTVLGSKGKDGFVFCVVLERQMLPDSIVLQKKLNNCLMCTYCGKTFNYPHNLKIHLRSHTDNRRYHCSHCNKGFFKPSELKVHLRIHTGEKPFKCSYCDKSCITLSKLNEHLRTHTGEKPYKCSYCNKSFARSGDVNVHLRTHTGEKPFKCSYCDKSFITLGTLKIHLRTHTGEKPYKCSHCNKSFAQRGNLNGHLRTHK